MNCDMEETCVFNARSELWETWNHQDQRWTMHGYELITWDKWVQTNIATLLLLDSLCFLLLAGCDMALLKDLRELERFRPSTSNAGEEWVLERERERELYQHLVERSDSLKDWTSADLLDDSLLSSEAFFLLTLCFHKTFIHKRLTNLIRCPTD